MAKRRKTKKTSHRRRRVSGVALSANSPIVNFGSIAAGYFLGDKINDALSSVTGTIDPKIIAAVEAVGGFLLRKKMKGLPGQVLGGVMMGAGIKKGLQEFGVINGLPTVGAYRPLSNVKNLPASVRKVSGLPGQGQSPSMSVIGAINDGYTDN
jgi:hypothetical protein